VLFFRESSHSQELASVSKVSFHHDKLVAFLAGEPIFPATIELDLTTECGRGCRECPSTTSPQSVSLDIDFVERLFAWAAGHIQGLVLSGGEPTQAATFPSALRLARLFGFVDVAVVTNGSRLDDTGVLAALLEHVSAVRISLYDWTAESLDGLSPTWQRITRLRSLAQREASSLQIGVSALTTRDNGGVLSQVAQQAADAGAHWIYFHPTCTRWDVGAPRRADQRGVLTAIESLQSRPPPGLQVFALRERYLHSPLKFQSYHAAHFLLPIGADGRNYLSTDMKYQPPYAIANLSSGWHPDWLWDKERISRISAVSSQRYPAMGSRYRGVLYSHWIQSILSAANVAHDLPAQEAGLMFPHIL
jgi:organic radical activating enzyme